MPTKQATRHTLANGEAKAPRSGGWGAYPRSGGGGAVIYFGDMLRLMNRALLNHQTVSLKVWRVGRNRRDPDRGIVQTYSDVYVTSHSHSGTYNLLDPLAEDIGSKFRKISEALIIEINGKHVYW